MTESLRGETQNGDFVLHSCCVVHALCIRVADSQYEVPGTGWNVNAAWLLGLATFTIGCRPGVRVGGKREVVNEVVILKREVRFILNGLDNCLLSVLVEPS